MKSSLEQNSRRDPIAPDRVLGCGLLDARKAFVQILNRNPEIHHRIV